MSTSDRLETAKLVDQLRVVELEFERAMRARGFDPAQAENLALTSELARIYEERETLKAKMASMSDRIGSEDETR